MFLIPLVPCSGFSLLHFSFILTLTIATGFAQIPTSPIQMQLREPLLKKASSLITQGFSVETKERGN